MKADNLLADVVGDQTKASQIELGAIPPLMTQLAAAQSALAARLLVPTENHETGRHEGDQLLGVAEAATKLGVTKDWLYRRSDKLPFTMRLGRGLRFSRQGIEKYITTRVGK
jgi:excisionase family DNA binding protein